ncbi:MAG: 4-hydroxybutyrate CoA-transferase, partial [Muribaculaceae bacterium]|nr:4-hydroxybutyrate CoA-transferase [Muribaculaceae bacterium]
MRLMTADEAMGLVKSGDHIYIQGSTSIPETLVEALTRQGDRLRDVVLYSGFSVARGEAPYCHERYRDSFLVDT